MQHSNYLVLTGCGEHRFFGRLTAWTTLLVVTSSVLAVFVWQGGLVAMAWANCIPLVVLSGVVLPIYFRRKTEIAWKQSWREVWRPAGLASLPSLVVLVVCCYLMSPANWWQLLAVLAVVVIVMAGGAWVFGLSAVERRRFQRVLGIKGVQSSENPESRTQNSELRSG
jgi:hypothetical protein